MNMIPKYKVMYVAILICAWLGIHLRHAEAADANSRGRATKIVGEPYALKGNRLVFTNWHFIRSGSIRWHDVSDKHAGTGGSLDRWAGHMVRQDHPWGIRITAEPAGHMGPLVKSKYPWEVHGVSLETIIQDEGKYKAWGMCFVSHEKVHFCYLISDDAIHWERPTLGMVEFEGSRDNNIMNIDRGTVFKDPVAPPDERYKWVCSQNISPQEVEAFQQKYPEGWDWKGIRASGVARAVRGAVSPDGIKWSMLPEALSIEFSDATIQTCYDRHLGKYVMYTRNYLVSPRAEDYPLPEDPEEAWGWPSRRSIGRSETTDFRHFPASEVIIEPGPDMAPSDVFYNNARTTIPGAPELHLMFPTIYHIATDTSDIAMASSADGKVWHFLPGSPIAHTQPFGQWNGGSIFSRTQLIELPDGTFALPYVTGMFPHKYPRGQEHYNTGYATWPKGRIVAVEAPAKGEFTTVKFIPPGRTMLINAVTDRAGQILVEVASPDGQTLPGRSFNEAIPIVGDQYRTPVTWRDGNLLTSNPGEPVQLRFRMEYAKLYGLDFE